MSPTPGSPGGQKPPPPTSSRNPYRQRLRSRPIRELRRARPPVGSGALGRGPPSRPPHLPPHPRPKKEGEGSQSLTYSSAPPQGHSALPSQGREHRAGSEMTNASAPATSGQFEVPPDERAAADAAALLSSGLPLLLPLLLLLPGQPAADTTTAAAATATATARPAPATSPCPAPRAHLAPPPIARAAPLPRLRLSRAAGLSLVPLGSASRRGSTGPRARIDKCGASRPQR